MEILWPRQLSCERASWARVGCKAEPLAPLATWTISKLCWMANGQGISISISMSGQMMNPRCLTPASLYWTPKASAWRSTAPRAGTPLMWFFLPEPGTYYVRVDTAQQSDLNSHRYAISWFPKRFRTTEMRDCAAIETDGDDPYYGCQNNLFNQIHNGEDINVKPAWAAGVYGAGVNVVLVEQSGVDPNHPDLAGTVDKTQSATAGDDLPLTDFPSSTVAR